MKREASVKTEGDTQGPALKMMKSDINLGKGKGMGKYAGRHGLRAMNKKECTAIIGVPFFESGIVRIDSGIRHRI